MAKEGNASARSVSHHPLFPCTHYLSSLAPLLNMWVDQVGLSENKHIDFGNGLL